MTEILKQIGAKWAIVFAFDEYGRLKLHLLSEPSDNAELVQIVSTANEILSRFSGISNGKIVPPKDSC